MLPPTDTNYPDLSAESVVYHEENVAMKKATVRAVVLAGLLGVVIASSYAVSAASGQDRLDARRDRLSARLSGFQEVPAISTPGGGNLQLWINDQRQQIQYRLSYADLEAPVGAAHIHLGQQDVNGGVAAFLCGGGGKPACPPAHTTLNGTITAADVTGPAAQGIDAGEIRELIRAIRAGKTYANVHTSKFPSGEIRGQIRDEHD
jgi:hypothetical protein